MEKVVPPKIEFRRGPLTLTRAVGQLRPSLMRSEQDQELEIRSLQLALDAKLQENERWKGCVESIIENLDEGIVVTDGTGW